MEQVPLQVAIAIVEWENCFLVGQRPNDISLAGYWEFPGGKVDANETPPAAAIRECQEETGIEVEVVGEYPYVVYDYPHGRLHLRFFECRPTLVQSVARTRFRWVQRSELASLSFPPANAEILKILGDG